MKLTLNECRVLARQVCHSCWGPVSPMNRSCPERTHTTAVGSKLAVVGSIPAQDKKAAGDSNKPEEAHKRMVYPDSAEIRETPLRSDVRRILLRG